MQANQPNGVKTKMVERKLNSDVKWPYQATLEVGHCPDT